MYLSCARPAMNEPSYCDLKNGASGALPEKNSSFCVYVRTWYIFLMKRMGMSFVASSIGAPTNIAKLSNTFKSVKKVAISYNTIDKFLGYMQDAFIIEKATRFDIKGKKYIGSLAKYYFTDMGLRNAVLGLRQQEESHIMENVIYNELRRRGCKVDVGIMEQRYVSKDGKWQRKQLEVDFVVNEGSQKYYIQSALVMPDEEKRKQEMTSLLRIGDSFKKIIIVKDDIKPWTDENGILTMGLMDFLMGDTKDLNI